MAGFAWVTLATNDSYSLGALVLAHSLRRVGSKHDLAVLVTPGVTAAMREKLSSVFTLVKEVNVLDSKDEANLALLARPELGITFTKLHCWRLTQYEKCVFLDADTLVIRNCDELFEREELSAAPDVGWPDCFNSGVFVYKPSQQTFASITAFAAAKGSFDGGDQGLLNQYFSDWAQKDISKHLPFIYNVCSTATYSYLPAFKQFGEDVRIIHFIGSTKPWLQYFDTVTGHVQPSSGANHLQPLLQLWWNIFCEKIHPNLTPSMAGIAGALAKVTLGQARTPEQLALEEHMRKLSWEQGQIDYMGRDSFDNIWKKINDTMGGQLSPPSKPVSESEKLLELAESTARINEPDLAARSKTAVLSEPQREDEQEPIVELARVINLSVTTTTAPELTPSRTSDSASSLIIDASEKTTVAPVSKISESIVMSETLETSSKNVQHGSTITRDSTCIDQVEGNILPSCKIPETETPSSKAATSGGILIDDSQVPIQVAESVLEADVKESVIDDIKPVTEEAISTISLMTQVSVPAVLETAMEALNPVETESNVSAIVHSEIGNGIDAPELSSPGAVTSATVAIVQAIVETSPLVQDFHASIQRSSSREEKLADVTRVIPESVPALSDQVQQSQEPGSSEKTQRVFPTSLESTEIPQEPSPESSSLTTLEDGSETRQIDPTPVLSAAKPRETFEESTETGPTSLNRQSNTQTQQIDPAPALLELEPQQLVTCQASRQTDPYPIVSPTKPQEPSKESSKSGPTSLNSQPTFPPQQTDPEPALPELEPQRLVTSQVPRQTDPSPIVSRALPQESLAKSDQSVVSSLETIPKSDVPKIPGKKSISSRPASINIEKIETSKIVGESTISRQAGKSQDSPIESEKTALPMDSKKITTLSTIDKKVAVETIDDKEEISESSEESLSTVVTKELQIPDTPTIIEATPPTSPPIDGATDESLEQQQPVRATKKIVKKVVKKAVETENEQPADVEGNKKVTTRKIVKKIVKKKSDEDGNGVEGSTSGNEKVKKIVKIVKKTTKTSQNLDTEAAAVPETPPPGTSQVPIAPKRKLKTTTTKTTSLKSDSEP